MQNKIATLLTGALLLGSCKEKASDSTAQVQDPLDQLNTPQLVDMNLSDVALEKAAAQSVGYRAMAKDLNSQLARDGVVVLDEYQSRLIDDFFCHGADRNISFGDTGEAVAIIQALSKAAGYEVDIDGIYLEGLRAEMSHIQRDHVGRITSDGNCSFRTVAGLLSALPANSVQFAYEARQFRHEEAHALLRYVAQGDFYRARENVDEDAAMQHVLKTLGFYTEKLDGVWGASSEEAMHAFQREQGLSVDGNISAKTVRLLLAQYYMTGYTGERND